MEPGKIFKPGQSGDNNNNQTQDQSSDNQDSSVDNSLPSMDQPVSNAGESINSAAGAPLEAAPSEDIAGEPEDTGVPEDSSIDQDRSEVTQKSAVPPLGQLDNPQDPSEAVAQPDPIENAPDQEAAADDQSSEQPDQNSNQFSWQASEYIEHHHSPLWYGTLGLIAVIFTVVSVWVFNEWLMAAIVLLMTTAVAVYAHRKPETLEYELSDRSLKVGDKRYSYSEFKSFSLQPGQRLSTIEFDPVKRFMPRLSIIIDSRQVNQATNILSQHLPQDVRESEFIDRLAHALKF